MVVSALLTMFLVAPGVAGVRGTEWGMSKLQVKQVEGKPKEETGDSLIYEDRLGGLDTLVIYLFNHRGELYSIMYDFEMDKREQSFVKHALVQFDRISRILHEKYGPPGKGQLYSSKEKKIGTLLMKKPIMEGWQKDEATYVEHVLEGDRIYRHKLTYGHRGLTDEYEEFRKRKEAEKF